MHRHSQSYFNTVKYCFLKLKFIPKHLCNKCNTTNCRFYEEAKNTNPFYKWKDEFNLDKYNTKTEDISFLKKKK